MSKIEINDVVRFNEKHRFRGCFGIVRTINDAGRAKFYDVAVPVPESGSEFTVATRKQIEKVGKLKVYKGGVA